MYRVLLVLAGAAPVLPPRAGDPAQSSPVTFDAGHTEPHGMGAFLLAARQVHRPAAP